MKLCVSILLVLNCTIISASEESDRLRDFYNIAKKAYKEQRKRDKLLEQRQREEQQSTAQQALLIRNPNLKEETSPVACIECGDMLELTSSVNKILARMEGSGQVGIGEEIHALQASYFITKEYDKETKKYRCSKTDLTGTKKGKSFSLENYDSTLIFSETLDLQDFTQLSIKHDVNKTFYFRGRGKDADKVIEVVTDGLGKGRINYYRLSLSLAEQEIDFQPNLKRDEDGVKTTGAWISGDEYSYGLALEHEGYLPKKIKILDLDSTTETSFANIDSRVQVTSDKVGATFNFKDKDDGKSIAELRVKSSGKAEVTVPTQFNVYATDLNFSGTTKLNTDSEFGTNLKFSSGDTYLADIVTELSDEKEQYSVGHSRQLTSNSHFSVKYEKTNDRKSGSDDEGLWLRYRMTF